ncbi:unnamed protein product [Penicillium egyptiacum]|uniref:Uncharacterized protein n=1 Tax=Penicillium egyptiacum TaxID=1303716 RepID=A0A9W4KDF6_9EURO|nr:unnamed protein product [Penicillium egyptiacum]
MATQQGLSRRNGVIGFEMTGVPTPAIPLISPPYKGPIGVKMTGAPTPAIPLISPPYKGPIGFRMMPGPSSSSLKDQGPPHGIAPLVGPDTAHSSPFGVRSSPTQREVNALNARLADAEDIISRQESQLNNARSQASALRSEMATHRATRFVDQAHMDALINRSCNDRARDIDRQFQIVDNRLDQVAEELERAEGNEAALQGLQYTIQKDRRDVQDLRQIVAASEYNLQRQKRLAGAEDRMKGLIKSMDMMLAAAMQATRDSQVRTRDAPIAESSTHPVGIARRHVVGSQEPGSHGHVFDHQPRQLGTGKEHDPGPLLPGDLNFDGDIGSVSDLDDGDCPMRARSESPSVLSNVMSLNSRRSSLAESPMDVSTEATEQDLTARMLQADESQASDRNAVVQGAPCTTLTITPQQVEINDMMETENQLFYSEPAKLNDERFDGFMEWEPTLMITLYDEDEPAARSQSSSGHTRPIPVFPGDANYDVLMVAGQVPSSVIPPSDSVHDDAALEPWQRVSRTVMEAKLPRVRGRARVFKRHDRPKGSRVQYMHRRVNLPSRKRKAGMSEDEPDRKKRITKELVEGNGSLFLPLSAIYVMNTVPKVSDVSVPAVSQPTQTALESTESVKTEQVSTQAVMGEPAVSQPTQSVLEYTETVSTEQVRPEAAMSAPAVPQPTQAVSGGNETLETVQVSTEAVMSESAVSEPTQAALESTLPESSVLQYTTLASTVSIASDEVAGAPAPSEPAPTKSAQTEPSSTEEIQSVPAVTKPTLNESGRVVPCLRNARSRLYAMRAARAQAPGNIMSTPKGLQVTATSRIRSTSSRVASPEDASAKNAVATGTDSRAGVSKGTKRVEDAENPTGSAQQTAGDLREEMGGEEAAASGLQMPGAWPSDPPAVTASGELDMHEGSALQRGLWTGTRWLSFGVFATVMVILLSFPLWIGHLGPLVYALEGPEQFLEELRWEHGYDVPFLERIIYVFLRCFVGDRTLFG